MCGYEDSLNDFDNNYGSYVIIEWYGGGGGV